MPMTHKGLTKLVEECGELIQVAAKKIQYPDEQHPDGKGCLLDRLEDELSDVLAAIDFVMDTLRLDRVSVDTRRGKKLAQFQNWDAE